MSGVFLTIYCNNEGVCRSSSTSQAEFAVGVKVSHCVCLSLQRLCMECEGLQ